MPGKAPIICVLGTSRDKSLSLENEKDVQKMKRNLHSDVMRCNITGDEIRQNIKADGMIGGTPGTFGIYAADIDVGGQEAVDSLKSKFPKESFLAQIPSRRRGGWHVLFAAARDEKGRVIKAGEGDICWQGGSGQSRIGGYLILWHNKALGLWKEAIEKAAGAPPVDIAVWKSLFSYYKANLDGIDRVGVNPDVLNEEGKIWRENDRHGYLMANAGLFVASGDRNKKDMEKRLEGMFYNDCDLSDGRVLAKGEIHSIIEHCLKKEKEALGNGDVKLTEPVAAKILHTSQNCLRFVHGEDPEKGMWVYWNKKDRVWKRISAPVDMASDQFGIRGCTHSKASAVCKYLKKLCSMNENEFDSNRGITGLPGGKVWLHSSNKVRNAEKEDYVSKALGALPDKKNVGYKMINDSVIRMFGGKDAEGCLERARAFQAFFGLCVSGDTRHQVMMWLVGATGSGKTTVMEALTEAMGSYGDTAPVNLIVGNAKEHETTVMDTKGMRFMYNDELEDNRIRSGRSKALTGSGKTKARGLFLGHETFVKTCLLAIVHNDFPNTELEPAMRRRIVLLVTPTEYPESKFDESYAERLAGEKCRAGIVAWLMEGYRIVNAEKKAALKPKAVRDDIANHFGLIDPVAGWILENMKFGEGLEVTKREAYDSFWNWAKRRKDGCQEVGKIKFGKRLQVVSKEFHEVNPNHRIGDSKAWGGASLISVM